MAYYLGVDQCTTNTSTTQKVILSSGKKVISKSTSVIPIRFTKEGWVEQDPSRMIKNIIWCTKDVINNSKIDVKKIASVGISNQTETFIVWDKSSGKPITPAISWQCKRSSNLLKKFNGNFNLKEINKKTGLNLDPTFTATKIFWLKKNYPEIYKKIVNNKYLIGTVDTWIIWNLTSGKIYSTDATNASRTLLCNINTIQWDKSLIDQFELKKISLPEIKKNRDNYGEISKKYFGAQIKINASIGDQQSSHFGNNCLKKGDLKITLGSVFLSFNLFSQDIEIIELHSSTADEVEKQNEIQQVESSDDIIFTNENIESEGNNTIENLENDGNNTNENLEINEENLDVTNIIKKGTENQNNENSSIIVSMLNFWENSKKDDLDYLFNNINSLTSKVMTSYFVDSLTEISKAPQLYNQAEFDNLRIKTLIKIERREEALRVLNNIATDPRL